MKLYDSIVIGGGPAGMTAALYLLRSGAKTLFVERLSPGGQVLLTEEVDNYPGYPKGVKGYELVDAFEAHLTSFQFDRVSDAVTAIEFSPGEHKVRIGDEWVVGKTIIVATGCVYQKLGLLREVELTGKGVSYCALCDGNFFRDQVVAVVGGGNSALEESLYLTKLVRKLYLVHRRDEFRGAKVYRDKVTSNDKIEILYSTEVRELLGDAALTGMRVEDLKSGQTRDIDIDGMFIFIGFAPQSGFLPKELEVDQWGFIVTDVEMRTNVEGVFAAGDSRSKLCRQVATAVGDGATAANTAFLYLENLP